MSVEIFYYLGYRKDNKIYPLGPFTSDGEYHHVLYRCRESHLLNYFRHVSDAETFDKSFYDKCFVEKGIDIDYNSINSLCLSIVDYKNLPQKYIYIKQGYYLRDDIKEFEDTGDAYCLCDGLTLPEYTRKLEVELKQVNNTILLSPTIDDKYTCADYSYYMYENKDCEEYELAQIHKALNMLGIEDYDLSYNGCDIVVIQEIS